MSIFNASGKASRQITAGIPEMHAPQIAQINQLRSRVSYIFINVN